MPISEARVRGLLSRRIREYGQLTSINGVSEAGGVAMKAVWAPAETGRAQTYLDETEWKNSPQDVVFPVSAADAPYNLAYGSAVQCARLGTGVVRRMEPCGPGEAGAGILALVVLTQRE